MNLLQDVAVFVNCTWFYDTRCSVLIVPFLLTRLGLTKNLKLWLQGKLSQCWRSLGAFRHFVGIFSVTQFSPSREPYISKIVRGRVALWAWLRKIILAIVQFIREICLASCYFWIQWVGHLVCPVNTMDREAEIMLLDDVVPWMVLTNWLPQMQSDRWLHLFLWLLEVCLKQGICGL